MTICINRRVFYRVKSEGFADRDFRFKEEAFAHIKSYRKGLQQKKDMETAHREYWKEVGKRMKLYKVVETTSNMEKFE